MTRSFRLRTLIVLAFVTLVIGTGVTIAALAYERSRALLLHEALVAAGRAGEETGKQVSQSLELVRSGVRLLMLNPHLRGQNLAGRMEAMPFISVALRASPAARAFYFADQHGNLFYMRRPTPQIDHDLPEATAFVVLSVERGTEAVKAQRLYFDIGLKLLAHRDDSEAAALDPRERDWFRQALQGRSLIFTQSYPFFTSGEPGHTVALATEDRSMVAAADYRHELIDQMLRSRRLTAASRLVLFDAQGTLLASDRSAELRSSGESAPKITELGHAQLSALLSAPLDKVSRLQVDGQTWFLQRHRLSDEVGTELFLGIAAPADELLQEARAMRNDILLQTLFILVLAVPLAIWLSGALVRPMVRLTARAQRLQNFDFSEHAQPASRIAEVRQLSDALDRSRDALQRFIDITLQLSAEKDFDHLLPTLLHSTSEACRAEGALLYTCQPSGDLSLVAGRWEARALELGEALPLFAARQTLAARQSQWCDADPAACAKLGLPPTATLSVPLYNRQGQDVGVLMLFHRQPPATSAVRFIEALAGFAALALETRALLTRQKALFEAFIQLIAGAIDAKSPYTGGHCSRVPVLSRLLAEATCAEKQGPYAGFAMSDEDWQALHIATWLHDCGKVTTPEYVVDKATKLETLYDRIHEIRMRFEVLKRDAHIDYLQTLQAGGEQAIAQQLRDDLLRTLDEEFAFVAACNTGFVDEPRLQRLRGIAERTWLRTLDDRLGTSGEERQRQEQQPSQGLPAVEKLLVDRPEHCIARRAEERYAADNPWGFNMPIPELLYDRGELKNLSISRGTLTEEERFKVNEHAVQTIRMLAALPLPPEWEQIPEIAGSHHERMDGRGYPRGLSADQLSPQARMVAIADVFEALTARDRPYKPSKTLSQALHIMRAMGVEGHLDIELLRIFIQSGACLKYARQYLATEQLDVQDLHTWFTPRQSEDAGIGTHEGGRSHD